MICQHICRLSGFTCYVMHILFGFTHVAHIVITYKIMRLRFIPHHISPLLYCDQVQQRYYSNSFRLHFYHNNNYNNNYNYHYKYYYNYHYKYYYNYHYNIYYNNIFNNIYNYSKYSNFNNCILQYEWHSEILIWKILVDRKPTRVNF